LKTTGLAILFSACALLLAQPALAATTHYVSPTGSGTTCSEAAPCDLLNAVAGLITGDTIVLGSGTYDLGAGSFAVPSGVTLAGAPGTRPTITSNSLSATVSAAAGALEHLDLVQTGSGAALGSFGSTLDDLTITSSGSGALIGVGDVLRNSVVRLTGTSGSAIQAASGIGTVDVRNVLVWAPGVSTLGIQASGNCLPMIIDPMNPLCLPLAQPAVNVRDSIVRAGTDLVTNGFMGYNGVINIAYSDYRAAKTSALPDGTIVDGDGNIAADPLFADAAGGDFHPVAGSPTIDAGDPLASADPKVGPLDLDGLTRILGSRIDMGPFEFVPSGSGATDTRSGGGGDTGSQQQGGGGGADTGAPPVQNTQPVTPSVADKTAPVLKSLRFAPGLLRKSSLISYLLNEQATTTLRVLRKTTGVKKGRTCAKAGRKLKKHAKRCTRWVVVSGSLTHADRPGKNSFRFNGKLRGKRLKAGSYRLVAVARDASGNIGKPIMVAFRVR
jgi:hypothetical protein